MCEEQSFQTSHHHTSFRLRMTKEDVQQSSCSDNSRPATEQAKKPEHVLHPIPGWSLITLLICTIISCSNNMVSKQSTEPPKPPDPTCLRCRCWDNNSGFSWVLRVPGELDLIWWISEEAALEFGKFFVTL